MMEGDQGRYFSNDELDGLLDEMTEGGAAWAKSPVAKASPAQGDMPVSREEWILLLKYRTKVALRISCYMWWHNDFKAEDRAWFHVRQISDVLGDEAEAVISEVKDKYKREIGRREWAICHSGDKDLQEILEGEAMPDRREDLGPYAQDYFRRTGELEPVDQIEAALRWREKQPMSLEELEKELYRPAATISEVLSQHPDRFVQLPDGRWRFNSEDRVRQNELADRISTALFLDCKSTAELEKELNTPAATILEILSQYPNRFVSRGNDLWKERSFDGPTLSSSSHRLAIQIGRALVQRAMSLDEMEKEFNIPAPDILDILSKFSDRFVLLRDGKWGLLLRSYEQPES